METHNYNLYGLCIASNKELPLLTPTKKSYLNVTLDLSNRSISELSFITQNQPDNTENGIKHWNSGEWLCIEFPRSPTHFLRFYISKDGTKVISNKPDAIPDSDVDAFILGPILGAVLRLQGRVCLHASVLEFNGKAFAMIGHKGAGKSTTAAALLEAGARLISDDVAVIYENGKGQLAVHSAYAGIRLMPKALAAFGLNQHDFKKVVSNNDKRIIPLNIGESDKQAHPAWKFQPKPCKLAAIYILNQRQADLKHTKINSLPSTQACIELAPHSYGRRVTSKQQQIQEFAFMANLSRNILIKSVDRPDDLNCLSKVAEKLLNDLTSIV